MYGTNHLSWFGKPEPRRKRVRLGRDREEGRDKGWRKDWDRDRTKGCRGRLSLLASIFIISYYISYIIYILYILPISVIPYLLHSVQWESYLSPDALLQGSTIWGPYKYLMSTLWVPYDYLVLQLPKILLHIGVVTQVMYSDTIQ